MKKILTSTNPISLICLWTFLLTCFSGCGGDSRPVSVENATQIESGVRYVFYQRNQKNRPVKPGDLLTFQLVVQNNQDSVLSNRTFQEFPFRKPYFISQEYYKDIFSLVSKGDSLSFWIHADSLANKSGSLRSPKIAPNSFIKYTLKMLEVQSQEDIRKKIEEDLKVQKEEDFKLIENFKKNQLDTGLSVQTTTSGIHYYFEKEGRGETPHDGDTVSINYTGKLLDGRVYNKSEETTEFLLGSLTPDGLNECIALMKAGSMGTFILPSELAYGPQGMGSVIPPNAVLVFDVELIEVK